MAAIEEHCGHAGPAFVQGLIGHAYHRNPEPLRQIVLKAAQKIVGEGGDSARVRAATIFGLLLTAGELAKAFGLLPATTRVAEAVRWGWCRFVASSDALALDPPAQAIRNLRTWIAERWDVTVKPTVPGVDSFGNLRGQQPRVGRLVRRRCRLHPDADDPGGGRQRAQRAGDRADPRPAGLARRTRDGPAHDPLRAKGWPRAVLCAAPQGVRQVGSRQGARAHGP
jgi:hypothetical protein